METERVHLAYLKRGTHEENQYELSRNISRTNLVNSEVHLRIAQVVCQ